jgi:BirA family transcriptional regulator, biotin operon repressor / biotin---[acetyl-CoA-carboxylase] ligase
VASFLRAEYGIEARLKWPNDVLVGGRKIAGILLEARTQEAASHVLISVGINVIAPDEEAAVNATSIDEAASNGAPSVSEAIAAFLTFLDRRLNEAPTPSAILGLWRELTIHRDGDRVTSVIGDRPIDGLWRGIDDEGRALIESEDRVMAISAGDVIIQ